MVGAGASGAVFGNVTARRGVTMPTETDVKLAEDLAAFRIEAAGKFAAIETELAVIRKLGTWLLGGVFGLVAALITGAATVGWSAASVVARVEQQGRGWTSWRDGWTGSMGSSTPC